MPEILNNDSFYLVHQFFARLGPSVTFGSMLSQLKISSRQ